MERKKIRKTYVIGHKNPDTDSIVSAIAYARLKTLMGEENCYPARAGKLNPQTEYILKKFGIKPPAFIRDLIPKVENYMAENVYTVNETTPLWEALQILDNKNIKMLPIVDDNGKYHSSLNYTAFAQNMIKKIDPKKNIIIPTSINHLIRTLKAQTIYTRDEEEVFKSKMFVVSMQLDTFKAYMNTTPSEKAVVIVGDREDIQKEAIKRGVRVLIVTGGNILSQELKNEAKANGVSVLISPYGTAKTSWLVIYSTPVKYMGDTSIKPALRGDYIKKIKKDLSASISRSLPVVDDEMRVVGVISQSDILDESNISLIMVDHNELSQAVDGIENHRILEVIDHHRLGNLHTSYPITFINKPVGSTATIIAGLYKENRVPFEKEIASILLAGILSDTILLNSATTTELDKDMADYLANIADLEIDEFGNEIMQSASSIVKKPIEELLAMDKKEYKHGNIKFSVSQIEVVSPELLLNKKDGILEQLENINNRNDYHFSALMVTDIVKLNSLLFIRGDKTFINAINYPKAANNVFIMEGVLSRKKQLIPYFTELLDKNE